MTMHEARQLELAIWHTRESLVCVAQSDLDGEDYHIQAAREYAEQLAGKRLALGSADELTAWLCSWQERAISHG